MAFNPATILTLTIAISAAAAFYLLMEWRSARDASLLFWSAGFATVTLGCSLALTRSSGHFFLGVWFANGLLVLAHWLFLLGVSRFVERRPSAWWWLVVIAWCALLLLPAGPGSAKLYLIVNSLLVALLALKASLLLRLEADVATLGTRQLHITLLVHGMFYLGKIGLALVPGTLIDLVVYQGTVIRVSLIEGVMAILLIALSMTGTVRYRRERQIEQLAERDPLTGLFNRRAFEARAIPLLLRTSSARPGALLLIDIDNFKPVNDLHGHAAGDRLLIGLSDLLRQRLPDDALAARLGGDEFAILMARTSGQAIETLADTLRRDFREMTCTDFETPQAVTLSMGATLFDRAPDDLAALIGDGDRALYRAKRDGRNRLELVDRAPASA